MTGYVETKLCTKAPVEVGQILATAKANMLDSCKITARSRVDFVQVCSLFILSFIYMGDVISRYIQDIDCHVPLLLCGTSLSQQPWAMGVTVHFIRISSRVAEIKC